MKLNITFCLLLIVLFTVVQSAHSQQQLQPSVEDGKKSALEQAHKRTQYEESDNGVHAQNSVDGPIREAQQRWRETHHPWKILVFHAFRPGILSMCKNARLWPEFEKLALPESSDSLRGRWLKEAVSIHWSGGRFSKDGEAPQSNDLLTDACFVFYVDDVPAISGAVVSSYSARLLDFPTLVLERPHGRSSDKDNTRLRLMLSHSFPEDSRYPTPPHWRKILDKISGAD